MSTGRFDVAGQVLTTFALYVDGGLIPSRFDVASNEPHYDTADAALWFVHAAHAYLEATRDRDTYDSVLRPACEAVVEGYVAGAAHGVRLDPDDGLVTAGTDGSPALTWMYAADPEGRPITPRRGKAVEVNALWHHALRLLGMGDLADAAAAGFREAFVLPGNRGLADVVTGGPGHYERDESLRPNQIFAASLAHSPLDAAGRATVVDVVPPRPAHAAGTPHAGPRRAGIPRPLHRPGARPRRRPAQRHGLALADRAVPRGPPPRPGPVPRERAAGADVAQAAAGSPRRRRLPVRHRRGLRRRVALPPRRAASSGPPASPRSCGWRWSWSCGRGPGRLRTP